MRLSLPVTFGGIGALGASVHLYQYGEVAAAAVLGVGGVLALAFVAWVYGVLPALEEIPAPVRRASTMAITGAFVFALVTSPFASPIGTAAAADTECSTLDALWYDFANAGNWQLAGGGCNEDVKTVQAQENLQQKVDLNQLGRGAYEGRQPLFIKYNNELDTSGSVVSLRARAKMVDMMENDSTTYNASQIRDEVHQVIEDYYAVREHNLVETYEAHWAQNEYIITTVQNDSEISNSFLYMGDDPDYSQTGTGHSFNGFGGTVEGSVTYVNGTTVNVSGRVVQYGSSGEYEANWGLAWDDSITTSSGTFHDQDMFVGSVNDSSLAQNISQAEAIDVAEYRQARSDLHNQSDRMKSNYDLTFIDSVNSSYAEGSINQSDLVTPEMIVQEYGANSSETGYLAYQIALMSYLDVSSPDLNRTANVEITAEKATIVSATNKSLENRTYEPYSGHGLIFARTPPSGGFNVSQTYNATNLTGPVWFINATTGERVELKEDFTIVSATANDGTNLSSVDMVRYNPETYDSSNFVNDTLNASEARELIEEYYTISGGGGGIDLGNLGGTQTGVLLALAAVVALFVLRG